MASADSAATLSAATLCVVSLGYIGLPTAAMFATHGFRELRHLSPDILMLPEGRAIVDTRNTLPAELQARSRRTVGERPTTIEV